MVFISTHKAYLDMWRVRRSRGGTGLLVPLFLPLWILTAGAQTSTNVPPIAELSLADFTQRVVEYSESIQIRLLELAISNKRVKAERGIFEPELFSTLERVGNKRENTAQQQVSSSFEPFHESVSLADTILSDVRISFEVGRSNELDVVQAEAGLALRKQQAILSLKEMEREGTLNP